ncbi:UbiA family prenyltransferase [Nonomuraea sp. NPDC002799]
MGAVVASSNIVNDIVDAAADAYDKPTRPLPSGRVPARSAWIAAWVTAFVAAAAGSALGLLEGVITLGTLVIGWLYSFYLKNTVLLGNATIALLFAYCLVFGASVAAGADGRIWVMAALMFVFGFAYLVLLAVRDHAADTHAGITTVATYFGERPAIRVFQCLAMACVLLLLLPPVFGWDPARYLAFMTPAAIAPVCISAIAAGRQGISLAILLMRMVWFPGLAVLAFAGSP